MIAMRSEGALAMADLPSALLNHHSLRTLENLSNAVAPDFPENLPVFSLPSKSPVISLPQTERQAITRALEATNGERAKAAKMLAIGRTTLYRKMKQYGIEWPLAQTSEHRVGRDL